jgi:4-aminobutyrate aminotransferase
MNHLSPVWTHLTDLVIERGEGCYVYTSSGEQYLDFTSGIGVTNTGHCHPRVVAAIQDQASKLLHGQINVFYSQTLVNLAEELRKVVPSHLDSFFFGNSGAEATEGAVKLAKQATKRPNIIVFQGSFHGRTHLAMGMTTSKTIYRVGYQPLPSGIFVAPFPYALRYGWDEETAVKFCLNELKYLLKSQTDPQETAAIILEPELGEGGYLPAPQAFMEGLREICDQHGILLIIDEVQTGFGRTGKWFAQEHYGVKPDIMVMAKGLASGIPMSAIAAPEEMMRKWMPGSHGGTYGGNPVAAASAIATINTLRDEKLIENAATRGAQLTAGLKALQAKYPVIAEVRGFGLMVGVEFRDAQGEPDAATTTAVQKACLAEKMLLLTCSTYGNVIRFIPPLVVSEEQIEDGLAIFERALAAL